MEQRQPERGSEAYAARFEAPVVREVAEEQFPREGPNNKVSELDLRSWETLFIESLKVLNRWDPFRDIAHLHGNSDQGGAGTADARPGPHEMWIEFFWQKKDWTNLSEVRETLAASSSIKYQLYYIYLIVWEEHEAYLGNQDRSGLAGAGRPLQPPFDEVFKKAMEKVIQLAHQEWESGLPNYVDRA